jgi:type I restriction enzyme, S subunit
MAALSELGQIVTGTTPSSATDWGTDVPFLTPSEMGWRESIPQARRWLTASAADRLKSRLVPPGSTSVVCIGATIGKVARVLETTLTNQQINTFIPGPGVDGRFMFYKLGTLVGYLQAIAGGSATPIISKSKFAMIELDVPPLEEQRRIAEVLGALDDLIDTNERLHELLLEQAFTIFGGKTEHADKVPLSDLGVSASRGVTPKYDNGPAAVVVLNQKCIRRGRVDLSVARSMLPLSVRPEKRAERGDTLVNSTGTGTLGRAARWMGPEEVHVDSHVTVVKARRAEESAFVSYALTSRTEMIELLAEGSTGQTELSRDRLLNLQVPRLEPSDRVEVSRMLDELDEARAALVSECEQLRRTRDELLPLLMSGTVRVRPDEVAA